MKIGENIKAFLAYSILFMLISHHAIPHLHHIESSNPCPVHLNADHDGHHSIDNGGVLAKLIFSQHHVCHSHDIPLQKVSDKQDVVKKVQAVKGHISNPVLYEAYISESDDSDPEYRPTDLYSFFYLTHSPLRGPPSLS
ncbi:hypothetical protein [Aureibacter tunicatorum]|uniref:Uncharacterized protein n=1 Tax=Aureibacter tunicatorum TaxID=866807 RepID=A0AAE3XJY2_9BACT|nr:hypothetical protein [Aureibacter tunicatorum]MDR6238277.1 hypothetical protein [Aureibacter tunicatorum]BDD03310.1 hypothetical protein AUTU_07930 [Aureibacter tunicatorum]